MLISRRSSPPSSKRRFETGSCRSASPTVAASSSKRFRPPASAASMAGSSTTATSHGCGLDREDRRQIAHSLRPLVAATWRRPDRAALRSEVQPLVVVRQSFAEHRHPRPVGETVRRELPRRTAVRGAIDAESSLGGEMMFLRLLGNHVRDVGIVGVEREREAEAGGEAVTVETLPGITTVVGAVDAAVVLLPQAFRALRMDEQLVDALADLGIRVWHELGGDVLVDRRPRLAAVLRTE